MRDLFPSCAVRLPLAGLALLAATATATAAQSPAAEIVRVVLVNSGASVDVRVDTDRSIEWKTVRGPDGNLVLELPGALPRDGISDLMPPSGLLRSVVIRVASPGPEPPPATRITITPRAATAHSVLPSARGLVVRFRPARLVPMPRDRYRVVADPCLNLRAEPALDGRVITCLPRDVVVVAVGSQPPWRELRLSDGRRGWASEDFLDAVGEPVSSGEVAGPAPAASPSAAPAADPAADPAAPPQPRGSADADAVLAAALADARAENRTLAAEVERLRQRVGELEATASAAADASAADDEGELQRLRAELAQARSTAQSESEAVAALRRERDDLAEALGAEQAAHRTARAAAAGLAEETDRRARLESELEDARAAAATRAAEVETTSRQRDELERRLTLAASERDRLARQLADAANQDEALAQRLAAAEKRGAELEQQLAPLESQRDDLERRLAGAESQRDELSQRLNRVRGERDRLAGQLSRLESDGDQLAARSEPSAAEPTEPASAAAAPGDGPLLVPSEPLRWEPPEEEAPGDDEEETVRPLPPMAGIPPAPEPLPEPAPPVPDVVAATVRDWAAAWADQRVADYLGFYAADFRPADGSSRRQWEAQRRDRVGGPDFIEVELGEIQVTVLEEGQAVARFTQIYRSDRFTDRVVKRLRLKASEAGWKIAEEAVE